MLRRIAALSVATTLGVAGAIVAVAPASAAVTPSWQGFRDAYVAPNATSISLTADVAGEAGITLPSGKSLTLDLRGHDLTVSAAPEAAALGVPAGTSLTIRDTVGGGVLTATGGQNGAGIGGSRVQGSGTITIQSGTVVATGGTYGAGIGGGIQGAGGTTTISGGTVTATAGNYAAGIGGSNSQTGGTVTITGGSVTAKGGAYGAGLGGGSGSRGGTVSISGGSVTTTGGNYGPGIGGAWMGTFGAVTISGGTVVATGGDRSAGIGGGDQSAGTAVTIAAGAQVTAAGAGGAPAVGAGNRNTTFGSLTVNGTLTIAAGSPLTIPAGVTVPIAGRLINNGTIDLTGTIAGPVDNHGTIVVRTGGAIDPAQVTDHNYLVTFVRGNGEPDVALRVYAENVTNSQQSAPTIAARDGYNLLGWRVGEQAWAGGTILTGDTTVTAAWQRIVVPFTSRVAARVTGTPQVGQPLTVAVTTAAAPAPTSYTYQWFAGDSPVPGATAASFTPTAAQLGRTLSARVTPVLDGYDAQSGVGTAATASAVAAGTFTSAPKVSIPGTPRVDEEVTATLVDSSPGATDFAYQWYVDGTAIDGATSASYTPVAGDLGKTLMVAATAILAGYDSVAGTAESSPVAAGDYAERAAVTISHAPSVGEGVTAIVLSDAAPRPTSYTYQWSAGGAPIAGATDAVYIPTGDLLGEVLTVTATPRLTGYVDASGAGTSNPSAPIAAGAFTASVTPGIVGTPAVGAALTATIATPASPAPTGYTYQWSADGEPIAGATAATYVPTVETLGAALTVTATPVLVGYAGGAGTSAASVAVDEGAFITPLVVAIDGDVQVNGTLTATIVTAASPEPTALAYQWYADGVAIDGATTAELTLDRALVDAVLTVSVTPTRTGYVSASGAATSAATAPVAPAAMAGSLAVTTSGIAQAGETLTAVATASIEPTDAALGYQWYADGMPLADETGTSLALTGSLVGAFVSVTVTATADGYAARTASTTPTQVVAAPAIELSIATAAPGGAVIVSGSGFFGGGDLTVELHSDPVVLGTITPAADGTFLGSFTIPANTPVGQHQVVVLDASGDVIATSPLTIAAPAATPAAPVAGTPGALAATGGAFDATLVTLMALSLLALGLTVRGTRRTRATR